MDHPDMALRIDSDAADLAEDPVVRQRLWPGRIDGEGRDVGGVRRSRRRNKHCSGEAGSEGSGESQASARALQRHGCLPMIFLGGLSRLGGQSIAMGSGSQRFDTVIASAAKQSMPQRAASKDG